jgi:hypothetical protein
MWVGRQVDGRGERSASAHARLRLSMRAAGFTVASAACAVDPLPRICTDVEPGELVITEIRGNVDFDDTAGSDSGGSTTSDDGGDTTGGSGTSDTGVLGPDRARNWLEIRNVGDRTIDLHGLIVRNAEQDGSSESTLRVRYHRELPAGDAYVLGLTYDHDRPGYVDYGLRDALADENFVASAGRLELASCDTTIDLVRYDTLPGDGTWSYGVEPPDAEGNDDDESWCVDTTFAEVDGIVEPGTPGEANRPCV